MNAERPSHGRVDWSWQPAGGFVHRWCGAVVQGETDGGASAVGQNVSGLWVRGAFAGALPNDFWTGSS